MSDTIREDAINAHLKHVRGVRRSEALIVGRARVLRTLPDPILTPTHDQIDEWWSSRQLTTRGELRAASSLSQDVSHARKFWQWAMKRDLIERNPADWLEPVRQKKHKPRPVMESDLYSLMHAAPDEMRRMLALCSMAGLRSAEVAKVEWSDIDRGNGVLWVREGKGGKDRSVPLSGGLLAELGDPAEGRIIGREMTAKAVSQAIGRYMRAADVDFTAHKLRARYATRFLAATGDLASAAEAMGHSDLSSISRYVLPSSDTMRRGAEAAGRIG